MRVRVDEAGGNDVSTGIDLAGRRGAIDLPDCGDAAACNADVGTKPRRTGAVDD